VVPGFLPGAYPVVLTASVDASNALTFTVTPPIMGVAGPWDAPRGPAVGRYVIPTGGAPRIKSDA
jgi:hypothetical protein